MEDQILGVLGFIVAEFQYGNKLLAILTSLGTVIAALAIFIRSLDAIAKALMVFAQKTKSPIDDQILTKTQVFCASASWVLTRVTTFLAKIPAAIHGK